MPKTETSADIAAEQELLRKAREALAAFQQAAYKLNAAWHPALDNGYPEHVTGSFDEVCLEVSDWRETVESDLAR